MDREVGVDRELTGWSLAGVAAGAAGLASSYAAAMLLTIRDAPLLAVGDVLAALTPEEFAMRALSFLGALGGPLLTLVLAVVLLVSFVSAGRLRRQHWWSPLPVWAALAGAGVLVTLAGEGTRPADLLPSAFGFAAAALVLELFALVLRHPRPADTATATGRRAFVVTLGIVALASAGVSVVSRVVGAERRHVAETRRLLRLEGLTRGRQPVLADLGVPGVPPWQTPTEEFFVFHETFAMPTVEPDEWWLRVHGMVEREVRLSYTELVGRELHESWGTLVGVRNEVGGDQIGNAWWSGVLVADLLREAGVRTGADCVVQTGADGWRCATPLPALTDDRGALLAVGMNGRPLPIEHGFPARTIVPGLYGYVSAAKWVVDLEVTRFDALEEPVVDGGWAPRGPVKIGSRIDVPGDGDEVGPGPLVVAGSAWAPVAGVRRVEVALDGGAWEVATLGDVPSAATWVQWSYEFDVDPGEHVLVVRASDEFDTTQTSARRDPKPDGATGWHTIEFTVLASPPPEESDEE